MGVIKIFSRELSFMVESIFSATLFIYLSLYFIYFIWLKNYVMEIGWEQAKLSSIF